MALLRRSVGFAGRLFSTTTCRASLAAADDVSKLGPKEVAVQFSAAQVTGTNEMQSATGVVTAVGSGVTGIAANDTVASVAGVGGAFREVAKVPAGSLLKLPAGVPPEFGCLLEAPLTAALLLKDVAAGATVVQSGAGTPVGQAVVQLAKAKGIQTVSIVEPHPESEELVKLLKNIGGDIVMPIEFAHSSEFNDLMQDLSKPTLAIHCIPFLQDPSILKKVPAGAAPYSQWKVVMEDALFEDKRQIKISATLAAMSAASVSHGPYAAELPGTAVSAKSVGAKELEAELALVSDLLSSGSMSLWVESFPPEDLKFATETATQLFHSYRTPVLNFGK
uniref:Enoyl reductase (ER) domain-containing protein n=1 Tax=Rhizochromulina marina TaxID=1034831 RepID=A0A7S2SEI5_9STRA